jgi:hypothetical protein
MVLATSATEVVARGVVARGVPWVVEVVICDGGGVMRVLTSFPECRVCGSLAIRSGVVRSGHTMYNFSPVACCAGDASDRSRGAAELLANVQPVMML